MIISSKKTHPRQIAWMIRNSKPIQGMKEPHRGRGCYGCCGNGTRGGYLCTVCHKYYSVHYTYKIVAEPKNYKKSKRDQCCGYVPVFVNSRIEIPPINSKYRWKQFLEKFPQFRFREELKYVPEMGE